MPVGTAGAIIGGSIISGGLGALGASKAADAQKDASAAGVAEQRRQFNTILGLTQPQRQVGNAALNTLASAFIPGFGGLQVPQINSQGGPLSHITLPPGGGGGPISSLIREAMLQGGATVVDPNAQQPPMETLAPIGANQLSSMFRNLPGTEFAVNEMNRAVGNSFASRGGAFSGNAVRALGDRQANLASDRVFNNLFQLAGFGPQGTSTASSAAMNAGNNISGLLQNAGQARASGYMGMAGSLNNAFQGGMNNWLIAKQLGMI